MEVKMARQEKRRRREETQTLGGSDAESDQGEEL
jgi:hypothetical protein